MHNSRFSRGGRGSPPVTRVILVALVVFISLVLLLRLAAMVVFPPVPSGGFRQSPPSVSIDEDHKSRPAHVKHDTDSMDAPTNSPPTVAAEFAREGFLSPLTDPVPPFPASLEPEGDPVLRSMNEPYHGKRRRLRAYQQTHNLGPLRTHTFFTTDCTYHVLWQSLAMEHTWNQVQQGGFLTRIVSGCANGSQRADFWMKSVLPADVAERRLGTYFVPTFTMAGYQPFNRPNGIWYWLNHTDLTEQIFVLIDPDMIFMHRLRVGMVVRGRPAAQFYDYMQGTGFDKFKCELCPDRAKAFGGPEPHKKKNYDVGPPWMLHIDDLKTIMPRWIGLIPPLHRDTKLWITEMVAYSLACAYHGLPHRVFRHGQVDNENSPPDAWDASGSLVTAVANEGEPTALLHYCYTYEVGEKAPKDGLEGGLQQERMEKRDHESGVVTDYYHFSKYRVPTDWPAGHDYFQHNLLQCNCPIFQEFATTKRSWTKVRDEHQMGRKWKRTRIFLDNLLPVFNDVLRIWKRDVLRCHVPTEEEESQFDQAAQRSTDPAFLYSVKAPEKYRQYINLLPLLRTSHPSYWLSHWVVVSQLTNSSDIGDGRQRREIITGREQDNTPDAVAVVPAAEGRRLMWSAERKRLAHH